MTAETVPTIPAALAEALRAAEQVAVLTGAGISAESGLATFRDKLTGLWAQYNPEDLATPRAFRNNPRLVWDWYAWRREQARQAAPNAGHRALVDLERRVPHLRLITQNVDGLHQRAGSTGVIELHGSLARFKCFEQNHAVAELPASDEAPPRCPVCGGLLRPDIVWFGEMLPGDAIDAAVEAASSCQVFLSIGTSGFVEPAASLPNIAYRRGATVAVINLDVMPQSSGRLFMINGKAGMVLPALLRAAWPV